MRLGWTVFVVPFLFVFSGTLLMQGSLVTVAVDFAAAVAGVWFFLRGDHGIFGTPAGRPEPDLLRRRRDFLRRSAGGLSGRSRDERPGGVHGRLAVPVGAIPASARAQDASLVWRDILIPYPLPFALTGVRQALGRSCLPPACGEAANRSRSANRLIVNTTRRSGARSIQESTCSSAPMSAEVRAATCCSARLPDCEAGSKRNVKETLCQRLSKRRLSTRAATAACSRFHIRGGPHPAPRRQGR